MKVQKANQNSTPGYPSHRQFAESKVLIGIAAFCLGTMMLEGCKPRRQVVAPGGMRQVPISEVPVVSTGPYDQLLHGLCDRLWAEPSLSEMNNQRPTVPITVTIGSNGRILNAVISEPSGVAAMDGSVRRLCDRLRDRQLPPFVKFNVEGTVITRQIALQVQ